VVALLALIASVIAALYARSVSRNTDLMHLHEYLMTRDVQAGRRELHRVFNSGADWAKTKKRHPEQFDAINHAVSAYQRLAQYTRLGYVPKKRAVRLWGSRLVASWPAIESFVASRRETENYPKSSQSLVWFARECGAPVSLID